MAEQIHVIVRRDKQSGDTTLVCSVAEMCTATAIMEALDIERDASSCDYYVESVAYIERRERT